MTERKPGRPSLYSAELAERIVELIAEGHSERQIAKMDGMPSVRTILSWKDKHPEFLRQSVRAREAAAELFDDLRREAAEKLFCEVRRRLETGEDFPRGVVEGFRAYMQEAARSAAQRDDRRFGDRKSIRAEISASGAGGGMAEVYSRMAAAVAEAAPAHA